MKEGGTAVTIKGIVIPVDWDEKGTVLAAALSTHHEEEYVIHRDSKGKKLMTYMQQEVKVKGVVRKSNNTKTITVNTYEVMST